MEKMNKTIFEYIKFAYWAVKSKQSTEDCLKLSESPPEVIAEYIKKIINDESLNQEIYNIMPNIVNKKKKPKPDKPVNECVLKNMQSYDTTHDEAHKYETHCHNCGKNICIGQKYCGKGCFKFIEEFNYNCYWGKSCKMCHTHEQYIIVTRNFMFSGKNYWIDDEQNVYNDESAKIATMKDGNIIY